METINTELATSIMETGYEGDVENIIRGEQEILSAQPKFNEEQTDARKIEPEDPELG